MVLTFFNPLILFYYLTLLCTSGLCYEKKSIIQIQSYDMQFSNMQFSTFPHQAPCRKMLNSVLRGLELTIFQSDRDIYIPNCDTRGFYRKKQVLVE